MRLTCRIVAVTGAMALLGPLASAVASPVMAAPVAHFTPAAPLTQHATARVCPPATTVGQMACLAIRQTDTVQPPGVKPMGVSPAATPAGFGPSSLAAAYKLDQSKGSGQTVAIIDAYDDPNAASDLAAYRTQYGLPPCAAGGAGACFEKVSQSGSTTALPGADAGWALEISLDLDMVSATCPKCHILLVEANTSSILDLGPAVNEAVTLGAKFVSNSYGGPESGSESSFDSSYYHHAGVAITASAGDSGYGALYPATGGYVTAVGGTSLKTASNARGWAETAWNGTGSGCSSDVAKPSFQASINTGCSRRAEADVSAVADPNTGVAGYDTYQAPGWQVYGGTSAASPIIASVYALAGTPGPSDNPNVYPYNQLANLFDVTSGSNGTCSPAVLCTAGTGWDGPTGLGTPDGTGAFSGVHTVSVTNPGSQATTTQNSVTLQIHGSETGSSAPLVYGASGLPPGLTISSATGLISGTPTSLGKYTVTATAGATDDLSVSGSAIFTWAVQVPGTLVSLPPARVLDTRDGTGVVKAAVGPETDLVVPVDGRGGVPGSGVSAVVVNLTVTQPVADGFIAAWADGGAIPPVSNLNFMPNQTVPNLAIVPVGTDGAIRLHNGSSGTVQLIGDISGYYLGGTPTASGTLVSLPPARVLDTRYGIGPTKAAVGPGADLVVPVDGRGGVPDSGVSAVVVNLTVTQPVADGFIAAWAGGGAIPAVSNLNFMPNQTVPNLAIVPVGTDGAIRLHNGSSGTVQLIGDISGYYLGGTPTASGTLVSLPPARVLDTRDGTGVVKAAVGPGADLVVPVDGRGGVPDSGVSAVVVNLTVTQPVADGFIAAWADGGAIPPVSNLNFMPNQTVPNLAIVPVGTDGAIRLHNGSSGTVQLIGDISGYSLG